jgi:choline dehydrogenase
LSKFNITMQVSLPGVGENLQDQTNVVLLRQNKANITGFTPYSTFPTAADLFGRNTSRVAADAKRNLSTWASKTSDASDNAISVDALLHVFRIQHNLAFEKRVPSSELITGAGVFPGAVPALLVSLWPLLPFSRGTVHIASADPLQPPEIDSRFFALDIDLKWAVATARLAERSWATEPMKALVGPAIVPAPREDAPDAEWEVFVKTTCQYISHSDHFSFGLSTFFLLTSYHLSFYFLLVGSLSTSADIENSQLPPIYSRSALPQ